jgi:hypothetical protein
MTAPLEGIKVVQKASCVAVSVRSVCRLKDGWDPETPSKSRPQFIVGRPSDD